MRLCFPITAFCVLTSLPAYAQWQHYVIDSVSENQQPRLVMRGRTPHVAYYTDAGVEYAVWDSGGWVKDTIDIAASRHNGRPALTFDRDGRPHVAWYRGTPWYAYWDGTEWQREEIDPDSAGDYISLVLDSEGNPSVAYARPRSLWYFVLKFARRDSLGWHPLLLDSDGGADCVLAIDTAGRFCIAHCQSWSSGAVFFTAQTESGWVKTTVVPASASQSNMVLDENGDPHISYFASRGDDGDLCYAERVGSVWRLDVIDPGPPGCKRGWDNWIARDASGTYHVSYHAHNETQLRYARGTYGNWQSEAVHDVGGWNLGSSIDLDPQGRPVIAYVHEDQAFRLYLSAAYDLAAVEENGQPPSSSSPLAATIVRGILIPQPSLLTPQSALFTATGRKALDLRPGPNDVRHLAPGVYFVHEAPGTERGASSVTKVVLAR